MFEVFISEFKAKCIALLEQVRVTRHGNPIAEIVPPTAVVDRNSMFGSMKESTRIIGDIISPANDEDEWEVLRD